MTRTEKAELRQIDADLAKLASRKPDGTGLDLWAEAFRIAFTKRRAELVEGRPLLRRQGAKGR